MGDGRSATHSEWLRMAVRDYEPRLMSYCVHLLGDVDGARDVTQEAFMRLCAQPMAQVESKLGEWLFTVCRNLCIDVRRKSRRMTLLAEGQAELQVAGEPAPGAAIEQTEMMSQVMASLATLSQNQQEVVRLKFQHGLSYKQIAGITNLTVTNVGFLIHTALKNIREQVVEQETEKKKHRGQRNKDVRTGT